MGLLLTFIRFRLTAMVAASALAGYLLHPWNPGASGAVVLTSGVFLLAAGGSALNQVQERTTDALMARTRHRPLPAGQLSPRAGLAVSLALFASALALLLTTGPVPTGLGVFAIVWYNGVYTPLKKITPWALLPGALCGALPPMLGWTAAGGALFDYRIVLPAGIFFLWQVPHFWFLALKHRSDLQRAGLPTLFFRFTPAQVERLALLWVLSLASATLLLLGFELLRHPATRLLALVVAVGLAGGAVLKMVGGGMNIPRGEAFGKLNLALLLILSSLLIEGFL
jgi:protoheme IX farnesyltransferase